MEALTFAAAPITTANGVTAAHYTGAGTRYVVEANNGDMYDVYVDNNSDVAFKKSTDGGLTWGSATVVFAGTATQLAIWFDRWSGIAAGLIHLAYSESATDDILYRTINTESADALSTQTVIFAGASTLAGGALSITRARGGNVFCMGCIDAGTESITSKLVNANVPNGAWSAALTASSIAADAIGASELAADAAVEIAAAVWDRVLTGATHNIVSSAGRRLRQLDAFSVHNGTASAGGSNSITLTGGSATNEIYDSNLVVITAGTGAGQARVIVEYNGTTKVAIVDRAWEVMPDNTSEFQVLVDHQADLVDHGVAQSGTASTITLANSASAVDGMYVGQHIFRSLIGQTRLITGYVGATRVATVSPDWVTNPDATSVYKIIPIGRTIVELLGVQAKADVNAEVATAVADAFNFTVAGHVDANIQYVNDIAVVGDGQPGTEWGP